MLSAQQSLYGRDEPSIDESFGGAKRVELSRGAWVEYVPGWLRGHATVFDHLVATTSWRSGEERMYDRVVVVPRVFATIPEDGPGHPVFESMRHALSRRYGEEFVRLSVAMYRDGSDSVAWHGDRVARRMSTSLVATVSVGAPRRFLLRPYGGGRSIHYSLGWGDLLVMGGSCQRTYQHSVPKVAHAEPRIAIMYRPLWDEDRAGQPAQRAATANLAGQPAQRAAIASLPGGNTSS